MQQEFLRIKHTRRSHWELDKQGKRQYSVTYKTTKPSKRNLNNIFLAFFQHVQQNRHIIKRLIAMLEMKAGCFAFIVFWLSCYCKCPVALPRGVRGWSAVCDYGIS